MNIHIGDNNNPNYHNGDTTMGNFNVVHADFNNNNNIINIPAGKIGTKCQSKD